MPAGMAGESSQCPASQRVPASPRALGPPRGAWHEAARSNIHGKVRPEVPFRLLAEASRAVVFGGLWPTPAGRPSTGFQRPPYRSRSQCPAGACARGGVRRAGAYRTSGRGWAHCRQCPSAGPRRDGRGSSSSSTLWPRSRVAFQIMRSSRRLPFWRGFVVITRRPSVSWGVSRIRPSSATGQGESVGGVSPPA